MGQNFFYGQNPWFANQGIQQQLRLNRNQINQLNQNYQGAYSQLQRQHSGNNNAAGASARGSAAAGADRSSAAGRNAAAAGRDARGAAGDTMDRSSVTARGYEFAG
jgi:hypothetical protein